jgi:hypothetical protein
MKLENEEFKNNRDFISMVFSTSQQKRALTISKKQKETLKILKRFYKNVENILDGNATPKVKNSLIEMLIDDIKL